MAIINIVRTNIELPSDKELESASKLLFDCFKGFTLIDNRRWRKLWKMLIEKEPGEMLVLDFKFPRNPRFAPQILRFAECRLRCMGAGAQAQDLQRHGD